MTTRLTRGFKKLKTLFAFSPHAEEKADEFSYVIRVKDYEPLVFNDDYDRNRFLQDIHTIRENGQLKRIVDSMARQQVDESVLLSRTMEDVNFARATVNGFHILEREIERYAVMYDEMHARSEEFDQHEILNG